MSKTKTNGLDQYGAEPFEQQQFGTAGIEGFNEERQEIKKKPVYASGVQKIRTNFH